MSKLRISAQLSLPLNAVTQKLAMLGRTGSGKTYAATKLAEEMHDAGAQIIALDPVGVWYGLRLSSNGCDPGIAIPVFGGLHGDVPLEPAAGALMADLIVDRGISAICDLSQFEHDTDKARFGRDFAARFFFRKKSAPSAVHMFLEECQEFLPEKQQRGEEHMLHAFTRMWKLGRNFGIGGTLISQRPQEVSKRALNLTECVFAFQLTGPHERKALEGWIAEKGLDEDLNAILPKLGVGEARAWSPAWLKISETVKISAKRTFNASSTPEVGASAKVRNLAPIDLEKIRAAMAATIEKAKAEDPRELRKQIAELRKDLEREKLRKETPDPAGAERRKEKLEEEILAADKRGYERAVRDNRRALGAVVKAAQRASAILLDSVPAGLEWKAEEAPAPERPRHEIPTPRQIREKRQAAPVAAHRGTPSEKDGKLGSGERQVLTAVAQYPEGATREQITILTGYKRSTRDAYIQRLQARGYVQPGGGDAIVTMQGVDALGPDFEPLPTGENLRRFWLARLPEGEAKLFELIADVYPDTVDRDELTNATGYKRSTRDAYLQRLATRKLIVAGRGEVRAHAHLFDERSSAAS